jgi:hypothetical protein
MREFIQTQIVKLMNCIPVELNPHGKVRRLLICSEDDDGWAGHPLQKIVRRRLAASTHGRGALRWCGQGHSGG